MKTTIILPCMNEEETIGEVIDNIHKTMYGKDYEIIVSNNSTDNSGMIAKLRYAEVINHNRIGYGTAIQEGIKVATGERTIIVDCDGTYDMSEIPKFLEELDNGADLVIGKRCTWNIPLLNLMGNTILTHKFNKKFKTDLQDTHCGFRAIRTNVLHKLNLKETGWEFAIEMLAKAVQNKVKIKELYTEYYTRKTPSKLKPFKDGWNHWKYLRSLKD